MGNIFKPESLTQYPKEDMKRQGDFYTNCHGDYHGSELKVSALILSEELRLTIKIKLP